MIADRAGTAAGSATGVPGRSPGVDPAHALLAQIRSRAESVATGLAQSAFDAGLAVTARDGSRRPIPIGALPVIASAAFIESQAAIASTLLAAADKAARWRLAGAQRDDVLTSLGPTERRMVEATGCGPRALAVGRVDFFGAQAAQALEVNATIPAMQGYADIAAERWLHAFAGDRTDLAALVEANGSNTRALFDALVALYRDARGHAAGSIALLCRRGDAQLTELQFIRGRFEHFGVEATIVHPDELAWSAAFLWRDGRRLPLVYRHLFLNRLDRDPSPALEAALADRTGRGTLVLNRPAPQIEMKSTLAVLSAAVDTPLAEAMGLTPEERSAVRERMPWTRLLRSGDALVDEVSADPDGFVLKRSWSYGGTEVFVGRARHTDGFWPRAQASFAGVDDWPSLVASAAVDTRGGGFIVQRAVPRSDGEQLLCAPAGARWLRVATDYAAFASLGATPAWSGVCRASASDIVNIVGGGALVPLLRREVADRLIAPTGQS